MNDFMKAAIKEAKKSHEKLKCGAVIVLNKKIIAAAHNTQHKSSDASAHAEILAIRKAGRRTGSKNLIGCTIYCTCEPCVMCLSAIAFAKIGKVVYGVKLRDIAKAEVDISSKRFLDSIPYKLIMVQESEKECAKIYL